MSAGIARLVLSLGFALSLETAVAGEAAPAQAATALDVLDRAFANRYELDSREFISIVLKNRQGEERRRRLAVATKLIDGRLHSLGRFLEPDYLRGTTILSIENADRSDDHFVFLRTLGRVRRVSTNQRSDAFMGTDLTYEDFERRRVGDYEITAMRDGTVDDESVHVIAALPRFDSAYERVVFHVARTDVAILETRYFKRNTAEAFKVIRAPRAHTALLNGHTLPTLITVENRTRGTQTEVRIENISVNPDLEDGLFTSASVEVGRPIPGLETEEQ